MSAPSLPPGEYGWESWMVAMIGADDAWLTGLLCARPDLVLAAPGDFGALAELVVSRQSIVGYYDLADCAARQVLDALCVLPTPTDLGQLATALNTDPAALFDLVERLMAAALILPSQPESGGPKLVRNPGLPAAVRHPAGLAGSLREMMSRYPVRDLSEIGMRLGIIAKGSKDKVLDLLAEALSTPERVVELVNAGPEGTPDLARRLSAAPLEVTMSWGMYETARSDSNPEGWLLRRGLLVPTAWGSAMMPAEVALALRGGRLFEFFSAEGPPLSLSDIDVGQVDRRAAEVALTLVSDVGAVLEAWSAEPAKMLRSGGLGVREVRRVAKLTGRSDTDAARLIELISLAGLADIEGEQVLPTARYDRWSELVVAARWQDLAYAWKSAPLHLSVAGATDTKGKPIPAFMERHPEVNALARRLFVLAMIIELPTGRAFEAQSAIFRLDWRLPSLWKGGPTRPLRLIAWALDEAEMVGLVSDGAASSFGRYLIDGDAASAVAALSAYAPPVTSEVVIQADLTAVASGEMAADLRRELELLADVESAGAATVYRFSETSLRRGFDAGRSAEDILTWLGERATKGVPQPLRYLIEDLARRFGRARIGTARAYLRSDDPILMTEMVMARKTARLGLRLLAPTVAVSEQDQDTVVRVLRDAGYLVAPEGPDGIPTLSRPPTLRAASGTTDYADAAMVEEILGDPKRLAAFVALPASSIPPGVFLRLQALWTGKQRLPFSDSGVGPDQGDDYGPSAVVARLRQSLTAPGASLSGAGQLGLPQLERSELELAGVEPARPTGIAKALPFVARLVEQALDWDWPVRLSYVDDRGREVETYATVLAVERATVSVESFPDGEYWQIMLPMIRWIRVATEAEEDAWMR